MMNPPIVALVLDAVELTRSERESGMSPARRKKRAAPLIDKRHHGNPLLQNEKKFPSQFHHSSIPPFSLVSGVTVLRGPWRFQDE